MGELIRNEAGLVPLQGRGMNGLIELFLKSHRVKENSRATYRRFMRMFAGWIKKQPKPPGGYYTKESIEAYLDYTAGRGLKPSTVSNALGAVRCFFTWAESMAYYPNIAKGVKGPKRTRKHKKDAFTKAQALDLLADIDRGTMAGARDFAIINLMIRAGLRTIEVSRANIGDLGNQDGREVLRIQGKGRDEADEIAVLTPAISGPIREYLARRGPVPDESPLFASHGPNPKNQGERLTTRTISRTVKNHLARIGVISRRLTAHSCRHSAVTFALMGGATIQEAQILARHADINTTLIYAHNIDRVKEAPEYKIDAFLG